MENTSVPVHHDSKIVDRHYVQARKRIKCQNRLEAFDALNQMATATLGIFDDINMASSNTNEYKCYIRSELSESTRLKKTPRCTQMKLLAQFLECFEFFFQTFNFKDLMTPSEYNLLTAYHSSLLEKSNSRNKYSTKAVADILTSIIKMLKDIRKQISRI